MKQRLYVLLLSIALIMPFWPAAAQEEAQEAAQPATQEAAQPAAQEAAQPAAQKTVQPAAQKTAQPTAQSTGGKSGTIPNVGGTVSGLIAKIIGYISQIGALFGKATGVRIGGTTVTAIATLIIAKLIQDKAPSWVKWILYAAGGTMFAGSGANITQLIMQQISL